MWWQKQRVQWCKCKQGAFSHSLASYRWQLQEPRSSPWPIRGHIAKIASHHQKLPHGKEGVYPQRLLGFMTLNVTCPALSILRDTVSALLNHLKIRGSLVEQPGETNIIPKCIQTHGFQLPVCPWDLGSHAQLLGLLHPRVATWQLLSAVIEAQTHSQATWFSLGSATYRLCDLGEFI